MINGYHRKIEILQNKIDEFMNNEQLGISSALFGYISFSYSKFVKEFGINDTHSVTLLYRNAVETGCYREEFGIPNKRQAEFRKLEKMGLLWSNNFIIFVY